MAVGYVITRDVVESGRIGSILSFSLRFRRGRLDPISGVGCRHALDEPVAPLLLADARDAVSSGQMQRRSGLPPPRDAARAQNRRRHPGRVGSKPRGQLCRAASAIIS
jgi:hypothetical protein